MCKHGPQLDNVGEKVFGPVLRYILVEFITLVVQQTSCAKLNKRNLLKSIIRTNTNFKLQFSTLAMFLLGWQKCPPFSLVKSYFTTLFIFPIFSFLPDGCRDMSPVSSQQLAAVSDKFLPLLVIRWFYKFLL